MDIKNIIQMVKTGSKRKIIFYFAVIFLLCMGTALRFYDLNRQSLWQDEIHTAIYVTDYPSVWTVIYRVATWDLHSPLYYVLLRIQVGIQHFFHIPLTDGNLRILSALLGSLALLAVFLMLQKIYRSRWYVLAGLLFAAIGMYGIYFSQELRMYAVLLLLSPLLLYFQLKLWDSSDGKLNQVIALGYIICSILILYSTLVGLFYVMGVWMSSFTMSLIERKKYPKRWLEMVVIGFIILLCYSPWVGVMWRQSKVLKKGVDTGLVITHPRELFKFAFELLIFYLWKLTKVYEIMNKVIRILIPFALLNLIDQGKRKEHGTILMSFLFAFSLYYVVIFNRNFQTARYYAPWWPFAIYFLVASFSGIILVLKKIKPGLRWIGIGMLIVFTGGYLFVQIKQIQYYFTNYQKENWREAVAYIEKNKQPGDILVVTGDWHKTNLTYYGVSLPFVNSHDLLNGKIPNGYKRFIYLGVKNPKEDMEGIQLTQNFVEKPWPVQCKNYYVWEFDDNESWRGHP